MFVSVLWDTIFQINDTYESAEVFLIDNHIPALRFGKSDKPAVFAAGFGAEDWFSGVLLLKFFDKLLSDMQHAETMAGIAVKKAFAKRSVVIIPTVCPEKMNGEGAALLPKDLKPVARYLHFSDSGLFFALSGGENCLYAPKENAALDTDTDTIFKILCACSSLPAAAHCALPAAKLCEWVSESAKLPSFLLSPACAEAAALERNYRTLEESFVISALL